MSAAPKPGWTVDEYLSHERASEQRHEYLDGEVLLMAGATENHNLIVTNILASLREYVLVAQDTQRIERYVRQDDGRWLLDDAAGIDAVMNLQSIDCTLRLADVYEKVEWDGT